MKKALCLATLLFASAANATLVGDTVHIAQTYNNLSSENFPVDAVVGSGIEFSWIYTVDISDSSIEIGFTEDVSFGNVADTLPSFNGPVISGLDDSTNTELLSFENFYIDSLSGFSESNVFLLGNNSIGFNLDDLKFKLNDTISLDLVFAGTSVPAPAPIALLGLGLLGFAAQRKKRN